MRRLSILVVVLFVAVGGCSTPESNELVVYSGRSKSLVEPLINRFSEATGISVDVRYGDTAQLAVALLEEGAQSPADVFWAQDAGALGAVDSEGLFAVLPDSLTGRVGSAFRSADGRWVGTSGRARALAYAPSRIDAESLPSSILDLTDPAYTGRVGWAPTNGSFQASVTAMRKLIGEDATRAWLEGMMANDAQPYGNNRGILEGIANEEVDLGIPNHYYLYPYRAADPDYPVEQTFFAAGDPGNLVNVAGAGVLAQAGNSDNAYRFVTFLLGEEAQAYFASENFEYPVVEGTPVPAELQSAADIMRLPPALDLNELSDLQATLDLLREVGLL